MAQPDYVLCMECESPSYIFEWANGTILEAVCTVCGNEDPASFITESDFEELVDSDESGDEDREDESWSTP